MAKRGPKGPSKWTDEKLDEMADNLVEWMGVPTNFWLGEFALTQGLTRSHMADLAYRRDPRHRKFYDTYMRAKDMQEMKLVKMGIQQKKFASHFIKFILQNNHRWKERSEVTQKVDKLDLLLNELRERRQPLVNVDRINESKEDKSSQRGGDEGTTGGAGSGQDVETGQSVLDQG